MANINDYLVWRGDIPISSKFPLNEVDSMILARFSYLRFDKINLDAQETIQSISEKMKHLDNEEFLYNGDKELIKNLGESNRFNQMIVTNYEKTTDEEAEKQFGAITIHLSQKEMYISFIGTDSTLTGWKEDVNMGFMDNVPCQIAGKKYLEKMATDYPEKKIRIGGHSKGGNVAIYAAITTSKKIQNRIIKVDNYDGPGFNHKIISKYGNNKILNKIETFIPQDSIIGRILEHKEKVTISLSNEKLLLQHDIYSWQVLGNEMLKSERNTDMSENVSETFKEWIENSTEMQRQIMFDSLFELFYSTEVKTFGEMKKSLSTSLPKILSKYKELGEEDKKIMLEMMKSFSTTYMGVIKQRERKKLELKKKVTFHMLV
ncbi:MAG: DUF2974 domain-containing protein [Clostridia bacterium]|nr:DUF2974 domain-containing protein [Clostridia bacterium]